MNEDLTQQIIATAERLASAAEAMERAVGRMDAQQQALNAQVERIVAAVDEDENESRRQLGARVAELERINAELKAEIGRHAATRKTLPPLVTALLAKTGIEAQEKMDIAALRVSRCPTLLAEPKSGEGARLQRGPQQTRLWFAGVRRRAIQASI
jgi:ABC-type transporter Mla subunit MlaD